MDDVLSTLVHNSGIGLDIMLLMLSNLSATSAVAMRYAGMGTVSLLMILLSAALLAASYLPDKAARSNRISALTYLNVAIVCLYLF